MSYATIAIIYNPHSTGPSERLARQLAARIRKAAPDQKVELIKTERAGHGEALAREIASTTKHALIISSSGDGGYSDVINGVMKAPGKGRRITTGLLAAGNANDHYRHIHEGDIVSRIAQGKAQKIDVLKLVGTLNGKRVERYAHSYIGFGLTPAVGAELNQTKLNRLKEVFVVARALLAVTPIQLQIGRTVTNYESVVCSNIDIMSKYLKISQPSSVNDGKFEVTIFKQRRKWRLILLLLQASVRGVREDKQVRKFTFKTVDETLVQTDGEIMTLDAGAHVSITIEKRALRCIV